VKLLLDENLSDRIIPRILDFYPDSAHVKSLNLTRTDDELIWKFAQSHGFTIVSKDADFHQRSLLLGHPPKFIYLRVGNCPTSEIIDLLIGDSPQILDFGDDTDSSILILPVV
jgi:predicted nuclease of predicted toxin-antitoxin system